MTSRLNKTHLRIMSELEVGTKAELVTNPYSGAKVLLQPLAVALYDFIKGCELTGMGSQKDFDQARYAFAEMWPDEYMKLLD